MSVKLALQGVMERSAPAILQGATFYIDATEPSAADQAVVNLGTGGAALNAQAGSGTGVDTNDPKHLAWNGVNCVYLPGAAGNYLSVPDEAALDITGDIDIRCLMTLDDWTPASSTDFLGRMVSDPNNAWNLRLGTGGTINFRWYPLGTIASQVSVNSTVAPTVADGAALWLRVVLDVDDGGVYKVYFYTSPDGSTWTQLGTTVVGGATTSLPNVTCGVAFGGTALGGAYVSGRVHRAIVKSGINGTTVLDVDTSVITSGSATSFLATTGQTVTINRATSGRKAVAVVAPCWLLGTDDYFEVPDNDLLDFAETDSFTVVAVHRAWATLGTSDVLVAKKATTTATTAGWSLGAGASTAAQGQVQAGDGTAGTTAVSGSRTSGALATVVGVRDVTGDTLTAYLNGTAGTPVTDATTGSLANAEVMRIGRLSGAGAEYADMELMAAAVFRRALTASEITAITNYFAARCR